MGFLRAKALLHLPIGWYADCTREFSDSPGSCPPHDQETILSILACRFSACSFGLGRRFGKALRSTMDRPVITV